MRILMICRQFLPVANGTERQAGALAATLVRRGHTVRVVSGRFDEAWPVRESVDGFEIVRLPSPRTRIVGTATYLSALSRYLSARARDFDVVHVHFAKHDAALAARTRTDHGLPVICKPACAGEYGDIAAARRTLMPRRLLSGLMRLDRVVAISPEIAEEWIATGYPAGQIAYIPNGVDTARFRPGDSDEVRAQYGVGAHQRMLLGVGRVTRQKGFDLLIEAMGTLVASGLGEASGLGDWKLIIAGDGPEREPLRGLARECGLEARVEFVGRVEDMAPLYRAADLFVLPSRGEGLSNALLEAMACGADCVATRVSGVQSLIRDGETGLIAEGNSAQSLAESIAQWASAPAGEFGAAARQLVESRFSLDAVAARYERLYESLAQSRDHTRIA